MSKKMDGFEFTVEETLDLMEVIHRYLAEQFPKDVMRTISERKRDGAYEPVNELLERAQKTSPRLVHSCERIQQELESVMLWHPVFEKYLGTPSPSSTRTHEAGLPERIATRHRRYTNSLRDRSRAASWGPLGTGTATCSDQHV
jgi:hypothetical protein